jgi:hypothetical protein
MTTETETNWFADHANVVMLTAYMADSGYDAGEVAYAVEKPWKFEDQFNEAVAALADDR